MSKAITGYEIARARRDVVRTFPQGVVAYRTTKTSDGKGGWTSSYAVTAQGTGRLAALDAKGQVSYASKLGASRGYVATVDVGVAIQPSDRIRVQGILLEVIAGTDNLPTDIGQRLICRQVGE